MSGFTHLPDRPELRDEGITPSIPLGDQTNRDGLQAAHIQGQKYWEDNFGPLLDLIDPQKEYLRPEMANNGVYGPERSMGGMTLATATHNGRQVGEYDRLHYDNGDDADTSEQFLNRLERETRKQSSGAGFEGHLSISLITLSR